jgi:hypothetical protein
MWYFRAEWVIVWVTIVYTVVTALALLAIAYQVWLAKDTAGRQLRAYLTVIIGPATFQERRAKDDGGDLKFGCDPILLNTGLTPARTIHFKTRAAILPCPLPKETHLPEGMDEGIGDSILGAQQNANMFAVVDGFCQDDEVQSVKEGCNANALYVWGLITYQDVFGDNHYTRFCQRIYWDMKGMVRGHYLPGRNGSD